MQLLLVALLVIFILLPGITFRLGYLKRDGLQILSETKLYIEILFVVFLSIIFHSLTWYLFNEKYSLQFRFNIELFYNLIRAQEVVDLDEKQGFILKFISYNFKLSLLVFILGKFLYLIFSFSGLKFRPNYQFLDYTGNWDRIFSKNKRRFKNNKDFKTMVDILVELNQEAVIYSGILESYFIDSRGYVDKITLTEAKRIEYNDYNKIAKILNREKPIQKKDITIEELDLKLIESVKLAKEVDYTEATVVIPNSHLVMYGSTIKNIGIRYQKIEQERKMKTWFNKMIRGSYLKLKRRLIVIFRSKKRNN